MRRKSKGQNITHQEIDNAVREFLQSGREINHLPDQQVFVTKQNKTDARIWPII